MASRRPSGSRSACWRSACGSGRLKTGTPARLDGVDRLGEPGDAARRRPAGAVLVPDRADHQPADRVRHHHDDRGDPRDHPRQPAPLAHVFRARSAASGRATAPRSRTRWCASPTATGHQIFLEPEGLDDDTVYPNGISTSLPAEVQEAFLRTIPGLETGASSSAPATPSSTTTSTPASSTRRWR